MPDGDFLDLAVSRHCAESGRPVVLVLHGLKGSAERGYMQIGYDALVRHGLAPLHGFADADDY